MTASHLLHCWRCGASLPEEPLPLARAAACTACNADLHVCRMCQFHDPRVANECRETVAERVVDKTRANFCGYLVPRMGPPAGPGTTTDRTALDALFGVSVAESVSTPTTADAARAALNDLFRKPK